MIIKIVKSKSYENSASQSYELIAKISDSQSVSNLFISCWESKSMDTKDDAPVIDSAIQSNQDNKIPEKGSIDSFEAFQNANIQRLSEAIAGKSGQEAIEYLNGIQEAFAFEIWERKEKSWAAELLKNQIRKTVESEKSKILPSYSPELLSKTSKTRKSAKLDHKDAKDKTIALFMKSGISESDAMELIAKTIRQTYEMGLGKVSTPAPSTTFKKCVKCNALNPVGMNECMICKSNIKECEYCSSYTISKDDKTCEAHANEVKNGK